MLDLTPVRESEERTKKELADAKRELEAKMAALAETQKTILNLLQEKNEKKGFQVPEKLLSCETIWAVRCKLPSSEGLIKMGGCRG